MQQLQGGSTYSNKTRIGNWNEDMRLTEIKRNDYQHRQNTESLPFNKTLSKVQSAYAAVPWTFSADGLLRSGDQISMRNTYTGG